MLVATNTSKIQGGSPIGHDPQTLVRRVGGYRNLPGRRCSVSTVDSVLLWYRLYKSLNPTSWDMGRLIIPRLFTATMPKDPGTGEKIAVSETLFITITPFHNNCITEFSTHVANVANMPHDLAGGSCTASRVARTILLGRSVLSTSSIF